MNDKILIVTAPDDSLLQGIRILHLALSPDQSSLISNALMNSSIHKNVINYLWKEGHPLDWFFDKAYKSDIIIFNADAANNLYMATLIGWIAGFKKSYYFGTLKDLHRVNDRAIYNTEGLINLMEKIGKNHD